MSKEQLGVVVVVGGLAKGGAIRLTEVGAIPLSDGAKFKVPVDVARALVERHPNHLSIPGATAAGVPTETLAAGKSYEIISGAAKAPTATDKAEDKAAEGKPANKSMSGKGSAQTK